MNNIVSSQVYFKGFHGDCSKTFLVGDVDQKGLELVSVTEECLMMVSIQEPLYVQTLHIYKGSVTHWHRLKKKLGVLLLIKYMLQ